MIQLFINRTVELEFLERKYSENASNFIVIYGKRRVGKTELIKKFLQNKKGIYILCTMDSVEENIKETKQKFYELTGKEYFLKLETRSFFDLFKYLAEELKETKTAIIIDEFPYLIELEKGVVSVFQKIWDEVLADTKIFLVMCGSSIGMMETEVLGYRSPLYGRRTGDWKVESLKFSDIRHFFKNYNIEELVKIWSVCGGVPFYLAKMDPALSVEQNIRQKILRKGEVLYNEPMVLLKEEFREPKTYTLILKYLSLGYNTHGELSTVTGIEKGNLSKYLSVLEETRIIKYVLPLGQRRRGIYEIDDRFFNFWFRFVYPNLSDLEIGLVDEVFSKISKDMNSYFGSSFESLIFEKIRLKEIQGISSNEVRKWWYKDNEIDVVALNEDRKEILFCECKWKENVDADKVLRELKEKAKLVQWHNDERKESYAIFARSFKEKFKVPDVMMFDLRDICQ
jgi:AAA+ ATPase superfamily predicted ATPase